MSGRALGAVSCLPKISGVAYNSYLIATSRGDRIVTDPDSFLLSKLFQPLADRINDRIPAGSAWAASYLLDLAAAFVACLMFVSSTYFGTSVPEGPVVLISVAVAAPFFYFRVKAARFAKRSEAAMMSGRPFPKPIFDVTYRSSFTLYLLFDVAMSFSDPSGGKAMASVGVLMLVCAAYLSACAIKPPRRQRAERTLMGRTSLPSAV